MLLCSCVFASFFLSLHLALSSPPNHTRGFARDAVVYDRRMETKNTRENGAGQGWWEGYRCHPIGPWKLEYYVTLEEGGEEDDKSSTPEILYEVCHLIFKESNADSQNHNSNCNAIHYSMNHPIDNVVVSDWKYFHA